MFVEHHQKEDTVAILMEEIKNTLPVGPMYFPEDMLTDQPEKLIVAELIREKLLHLLNDEVPHGIVVGHSNHQKPDEHDSRSTLGLL